LKKSAKQPNGPDNVKNIFDKWNHYTITLLK
jgi:hypothetical protein